MRRPAGYQHMLARQRFRIASSVQDPVDSGDQVRHLDKPSFPGLAAFRHFADVRTNEMDAVGLQLGDVPARGRMRPHARVHGRRDQHRLVGRQQYGVARSSA